MNRVLRALFGTVLVLLRPRYAWAQATAQINGAVTDPSGGVLPGATVTAIQTDTGFAARSSPMPGLVHADEPANRTVSSRGDARRASAHTPRRASCCRSASNPVDCGDAQLGQLAETVSVEASAPLVETRNPAIGGVIENERIEELPLNGRNAADLIAMAGAVVLGRTVVQPKHAGRRGLFSGRRPGVRRGVTARRRDSQQPLRQLQPAAAVSRCPAGVSCRDERQNAQNGFHSGASVNAVTKSGTNAAPRRPLRVLAEPSIQCDESASMPSIPRRVSGATMA